MSNNPMRKPPRPRKNNRFYEAHIIRRFPNKLNPKREWKLHATKGWRNHRA